MEKQLLVTEINRLKKERDAVILAHLYQNDEIQEIADFTGDSLELSRKAADTEAKTIVFCGVHFMAETAKILSPEKNVLLPVLDAGCPMADMINKEDVLFLKKKYPKAAVVCYVNSSAEVKAASDYCCTSSNAVKLVKNIPEQEIIFIPDQNLGYYVAQQVSEKKIHFWEGYCVTHHFVMKEDAREVRALYPDALILVHPECRPDVLSIADFVGSTSQIIKYARKTEVKNIIIGTEKGILYRLKQENPAKNFLLLSPKLICPNMKKTRLEDVYTVLKDMTNQIEVDNQVREKALVSLDRMLHFS